ncbi:MAG: anti-sigma factor [Candidatus Limnocylindrales bacterium]
MTGASEHADWGARVAAVVVERRPPDPELASHLADCAICTDEWRRLSGASARMIAAARVLPLDAVPPSHLRERVAAAVRGSSPAAAAAGPRIRALPWAGWFTARRGRLAWGATGAVLGAALAVVVLVGVPATRPPSLALTGSALAPTANGTAQLARRPDGTVNVTLSMTGLPATSPADFYELWLVGDYGRVSAGTFRSDGSPIRLTFVSAADTSRYPRIGITLEPDDGNPAASDQRVASST